MRFEFEGTITDLEAFGVRLADQLIAQKLTQINDSLAVLGTNQGKIMTDLSQQAADLQVITDALNQANAVLGNVSQDTTNLLAQGATQLQHIAELEALVAALPGTVDTTALDAGIAAAKATAQQLLDGLTALDERVPAVPAP